MLEQKIKNKDAVVGIIGLGYVGLPLAEAFANKGFFVYGFDNNQSRVDKLINGERYIVDVDPKEILRLIKQKKFLPTIDEKVLNKADVIIVCVPTPLRKVKLPDISYVVSAAKAIRRNLRKGQLIILESTSFPTTAREVVLPELKKTGLTEEKDFFLCFSPERVNPGDKNFPITKIPKVVGGLTAQSSKLAKALYGSIIKDVYIVSSPEVAETAKLLENTFRMVNIALANEFAMVCEKLGISIWEVIGAAKTKPFGFMPFYPGPGVGGHCLPCDPIYLSWKAKKMGFKTKMIDMASYINHYMPRYVVERVGKLLGGKLSAAKILIMGVTYKKDVKDVRESPAVDIIEEFQQHKAKVDYYDPMAPYLKIAGLDMLRIDLSQANLKKYDCVVIVTDHSDVDYKLLQKNSRLIFDTRDIYRESHKNVVKL